MVDFYSRKLIQRNHIFIVTSPLLESVTNTVIEHYDRKEYDGTLFVINQFISPEILESERANGSFRRMIHYNLEHINLRGKGINQELEASWGYLDCPGYSAFACYDELWDFLLENRDYYPENLRPKYKFMPLRYNSLTECDVVPKKEYKYDLAFLGFFGTQSRCNMMVRLSSLVKEHGCSFISLMGFAKEDIAEEMSRTRYVLDYPHYSEVWNSQNAVRIFDNILMGNDVVCCMNTDLKMDYFNGLVQVVNLNGGNIVEDLHAAISKKPRRLYEEYKCLTYLDEDYEKWRELLTDKYNRKYAGLDVPKPLVLYDGGGVRGE